MTNNVVLVKVVSKNYIYINNKMYKDIGNIFVDKGKMSKK